MIADPAPRFGAGFENPRDFFLYVFTDQDPDRYRHPIICHPCSGRCGHADIGNPAKRLPDALLKSPWAKCTSAGSVQRKSQRDRAFSW